VFAHLFNDNFDDNYVSLFFYWSKTMEREKGREGIRTTSEYEIESCQKNCYKMIVQISFLFQKSQTLVNYFIRLFWLLNLMT